MTLFYCKTTHPSIFKYLFEMLFHNMPTVPINITHEKFIIFNKTDNGYIFHIEFLAENFSDWTFSNTSPIFFGLGTLNSQDFKEVTSKSILEMKIEKRKSFLEPIILTLIITNSHHNLIKKFTLVTEEITHFLPEKILTGTNSFDLKPHDFTSLCKGFKTGVIYIQCTKNGFSVSSKLEGIREKCFLFPGQFNLHFEKPLSADKFLGILKLAMCTNKTITICIQEEDLILSAFTHLGTIHVRILY